jgi:hypothetical protein
MGSSTGCLGFFLARNDFYNHDALEVGEGEAQRP